MIVRVVGRSLLFVLVVASSCVSSQTVKIRDLPTGLQPIGALLEGCEHGTDKDGAVVARCSDDVSFKVRDSEAEAGSLARYFGDGVDLANNNAGRMIWGTVELTTSYDRGIVDRGEVRAVADDHVVLTLLGAVRKRGANMQIEVSCQSPAGEEERCTALLTAYLDLPPDTKDAPAKNAGLSTGAIAGRAISLPTTCQAVEERADRGRYACDDDAKLFWMVTDSMDDAAEQAAGAIGSLEDGDTAKDVPCALLDADTRCQETATALVGLGYLASRPIVVVCIANDPWNHGLCNSSFRRVGR